MMTAALDARKWPTTTITGNGRNGRPLQMNSTTCISPGHYRRSGRRRRPTGRRMAVEPADCKPQPMNEMQIMGNQWAVLLIRLELAAAASTADGSVSGRPTWTPRPQTSRVCPDRPIDGVGERDCGSGPGWLPGEARRRSEASPVSLTSPG
jgi:hypothetical protein